MQQCTRVQKNVYGASVVGHLVQPVGQVAGPELSALVVGRDHAGVGSYYGPYDAQKIFDELWEGALITQPLKIDVTFYCRKCYGMAGRATCDKNGLDFKIAWPSAEIAVMGPKGAVEIIFREEKNDPAKLAEREAEYKEKFANPFVAGARGFIDDVIMPHATRKRIARSLAMLRDKKLDNPWRKHGNIPL